MGLSLIGTLKLMVFVICFALPSGVTFPSEREGHLGLFQSTHREVILMNSNVRLSQERLAEFCRANNITELSIFGSALRDDFGPQSDIDFLVSFEEDAHHTLFDLIRMEEELGAIVGRKVDLVSRRGIERSQNYLRRREILKSAELIYGS